MLGGIPFRIIVALRLQNLSWFGLGIWLFSVKNPGLASWKMKIILTSFVLQSLSIHFFIQTEALHRWFEVFYSIVLISIFIRVGQQRNINKNIFTKFALFIGESSYELYLIHYGTLLPLIVYLQMRNYSLRFISLALIFAGIALVFLSVLIKVYVSDPSTLALKKKLLLKSKA
jgi:peptidoglycan/LPS O-acetylase OafA/YrhL